MIVNRSREDAIAEFEAIVRDAHGAQDEHVATATAPPRDGGMDAALVDLLRSFEVTE